MSRFLDILCWTHIGSRGRTNGHAAILMDGSVESADPAANAASKTYISWWPAGGCVEGADHADQQAPRRGADIAQ